MSFHCPNKACKRSWTQPFEEQGNLKQHMMSKPTCLAFWQDSNLIWSVDDGKEFQEALVWDQSQAVDKIMSPVAKVLPKPSSQGHLDGMKVLPKPASQGHSGGMKVKLEFIDGRVMTLDGVAAFGAVVGDSSSSDTRPISPVPSKRRRE